MKKLTFNILNFVEMIDKYTWWNNSMPITFYPNSALYYSKELRGIPVKNCKWKWLILDTLNIRFAVSGFFAYLLLYQSATHRERQMKKSIVAADNKKITLCTSFFNMISSSPFYYMVPQKSILFVLGQTK